MLGILFVFLALTGLSAALECDGCTDYGKCYSVGQNWTFIYKTVCFQRTCTLEGFSQTEGCFVQNQCLGIGESIPVKNCLGIFCERDQFDRLYTVTKPNGCKHPHEDRCMIFGEGFHLSPCKVRRCDLNPTGGVMLWNKLLGCEDSEGKCQNGSTGNFAAYIDQEYYPTCECIKILDENGKTTYEKRCTRPAK